MTDLQKQEKLETQSLQRLINRIRVEFSTKRLKSYKDYLAAVGEQTNPYIHFGNLDSALPFSELKIKLAKLQSALEEKQKQRRESQTKVVDLQIVDKIPARIEHVQEEGIDSDYGLCKSEKEKAHLYWHQKKFAKIMLDNILGKI
jgi:hypothetical protein